MLVDWSLAVDSTIARAHQHATNVTRVTGAGSDYTNPGSEPPDHAIGRSRGGLSTKIHQLVDGSGLSLVMLLTPGQAGDAPMFAPLMPQLRIAGRWGRPATDPMPCAADDHTARSTVASARVGFGPLGERVVVGHGVGRRVILRVNLSTALSKGASR
jgi:hypothetical protein